MDHQLTLVIVAEQLPSAEVAQMLTSLDKSFKTFVRSRGGGSLRAELAVGAVRAGSIEILLDAFDALGKLYLARQYLGPFATHLAQLVELAVEMQLHKLGSSVSAADSKAVSSLAAPVANGHAQQVNVVNNGSIVLNIQGPEAAKAILDGLASLKASDTLQVRSVERPRITERQIAELEQGKLMGSALLVEGTWYARMVGGQGVLVPITASAKTEAGLVHGRPYAFRGRAISGSRGETIGIALDAAAELGKK